MNVFVLCPFYGAEGYAEPVAVFETNEQADEARKVLYADGFTEFHIFEFAVFKKPKK